MKRRLRLWAAIGLLVAALPLRAVGAAELDPVALHQQWLDGINSGDIAAVMDLFTDDAVWDRGLLCENQPCRGKGEIQDLIEYLLGKHFQFARTRTVVNTYQVGDWRQVAVSGWSETQADMYRDAGLDRFISVTTLGLRGDKIASVTSFGDRADDATKKYLDAHPPANGTPPPPFQRDYGRFVDVGGRKLYLECMGIGSPTVILEGGLGSGGAASGRIWNQLNGRNTIQPDIAQETRVCAYDRAGYGFSDQGPVVPHTLRFFADDLHLLLHAAGIEGPYVLAGISLGGPIVRMFADHYPDEVAGIVLMDDAGHDFTSRLDAVVAQYAPDYVQRRQDNLRRGADETARPTGPGGGYDTVTSDAQERALGPLPNVPLAVLARGIPVSPVENNPGFPYAQYYQLLLENQAEMARNPAQGAPAGGIFRSVDTSNHAMNIYVPQLLAASVLDIVTAARQRTVTSGA